MDAASSKTILIVEDEKDVVDLLVLNLRKAGGFVIADDGSSVVTAGAAQCARLAALLFPRPVMALRV